jgi:hypothetical protein
MRPKDHMRAARQAWLRIFLLLGLVCTCYTAQAVVYKWADAQGRIHYSDRPPEGDAKLISVENIYSRPRAGGERSQPAAAPTTTAATATAAGATPATVQKQVANDVAKANADGCKAARERYDSFVRSRRVYKEGPNGERLYLSDQELATARIDARKDVDDNCAGSSP